MNKLNRLAVRLTNRLLKPIGYRLAPNEEALGLPDVPQWVNEIFFRVADCTMTSAERIAALCFAVEYVSRNRIEGDIVECGVWRGGSSMAAALALRHFGDTRRRLHLFDTFEGMPLPTAVDGHKGVSAVTMLTNAAKDSSVWAVAGIEDVEKNMTTTGYPASQIFYVRGRVEETIPGAAPPSISILRLDTDWYASTKHELENLWQRLTVGGVLIIDDYGHWDGARKAVDEFFAELAQPPLMNRIDDTGRILVKQ